MQKGAFLSHFSPSSKLQKTH